MFVDWPILSLVIWLPIIGGIAVLATANESRPMQTRVLSMLVAILTFILSIPLYSDFQLGTPVMQFQENTSWIKAFNINYHLGVDGISMPLILLTTFMTVIVVIAGWEVIKFKQAQYMAAFLIMEGLMNGVFAAMDAALFYVFWEAMLIPMFIIIGVWGGANRVYATIKFFLYTFFGSVFMLIALLYLYFKTGSTTSLNLAWRPRRGYLLPSWSPLPSRCPCGRSIPGYRMPTLRRQRVVLSFWPRSC